MLDRFFGIWPVVLGVCGLVFWLGGRVESPEAKMDRIKTQIVPIERDLDNLEAHFRRVERWTENHRNQESHPVSHQRLQRLEHDVEQIKRKLNMP